MRTTEITEKIDDVKRSAMLNSRNLSAQNMCTAINAGFEDLQSQVQITPEQQQSLEGYYTDTFIPALESASGESFGETAFMPESPAGQYVQMQYTMKNQDLDADYEEQLHANDSGDGTSYSQATGQYGDYFGRLVEQSGYEDALLLNLDGDVVFSAYKGIEMGSNVNSGPYRDSGFAQTYRDTIASNSVNSVGIVDFERWIPSMNKPSMWVISPVGNDDGITGAIAFQIPMETINDVMTGGESWRAQGLGDTGEVYLVGSDDMMRSNSRKLIEDPDGYEALAVEGGSSTATAQRIAEVGGTVLLQEVDTPAVNSAQRGESGAIIGRDYVGSQSVTAYAPLEIEGLD